MALFGRSDGLAAALARLEAIGAAAPADLEAVLEGLRANPEFRVERALWLLRSPAARVREFAAERVLALPDPAAHVSRLVREVVEAPAALRPELAALVCRAAGGRVGAFLPALLHADAPERRDAALEIIAAHGEVRPHLALLRDALGERDPELRRKAVRVLARGAASPAVFAALRALVNDEDAEVRRTVIAAFAAHPGPGIVEPFFERVALEEEREREVIIGALSALARSAQAEVEERVLPMLGDENAAVRAIAVRLLSEMPDRTRLLRAFLVHCRGLVFWLRDRSLDSISAISGSLVEPLLELMGPGEEEDVRVGAMLLARRAGDPRIIPPVREIFTGDLDWWVRTAAAEVLAADPSGEVTRLLVSRIGDPDLRYGIIHLLGGRPGTEAEGALLGCLGDPSRGIRIAALAALARHGGASATAAVERAAADDPDPAVRERAAELLAGAPAGAAAGAAPSPEPPWAPAAAAPAAGGPEELRMESEELNASPAGGCARPAAGPPPGRAPA